MILATSGMASIARPAPSGPVDAADVAVHVSLVHIVKIDLLPSVNSPSNGVAE